MMASNTLRALLEAKEFIAASGVFDMVSAKLADRTEAKALYMTGFGIVASYLGLPDAGLATYSQMGWVMLAIVHNYQVCTRTLRTHHQVRSKNQGADQTLIFQSRLRQRARVYVVILGVLLNYRRDLLHPLFEFDTLFRRDHITQVRPTVSPMVFGVIQLVIKLLAIDLLPFRETALLPGRIQASKRFTPFFDYAERLLVSGDEPAHCLLRIILLRRGARGFQLFFDTLHSENQPIVMAGQFGD
jgi:hypothetical protein